MYVTDVDSIIHSKAYARYIDKTQVVYLVQNEHVTYRGLHVQLVSFFSRSIADTLGLNRYLVEAIALGHDVGHPPFGHEGEGYLSRLSQEYGNGPFAHPWQSCRLLSTVEPLDLSLEVYDGFLCHDGGFVGTTLKPQGTKSRLDHAADLLMKKKDPDKNIIPGTLEGCLVKICDTISYLARDIEDAIVLGLLKRDDIPDTALGRSNRDMLAWMAKDIVANSVGKDQIGVSVEALESLTVIRRFNFERIYQHPKLKKESTKIERAYRLLFEYLLKDLLSQGRDSYLWNGFVANKSDEYKEVTTPPQMTVDYIAGMTDNFFIRTVEKLVVPKVIEL